jgi:hypothetical protein
MHFWLVTTLNSKHVMFSRREPQIRHEVKLCANPKQYQMTEVQMTKTDARRNRDTLAVIQSFVLNIW